MNALAFLLVVFVSVVLVVSFWRVLLVGLFAAALTLLALGVHDVMQFMDH